jgi:hypothetical protein
MASMLTGAFSPSGARSAGQEAIAEASEARYHLSPVSFVELNRRIPSGGFRQYPGRVIFFDDLCSRQKRLFPNELRSAKAELFQSFSERTYVVASHNQQSNMTAGKANDRSLRK